jgi:excisionase family DNA binding protein
MTTTTTPDPQHPMRPSPSPAFARPGRDHDDREDSHSTGEDSRLTPFGPDNQIAPASTPGERLVLTVAEAGELLGLSRAFAYELVARGELPVVRFGRRIVVPKAALLELLGSAASGA